MLRVMDGSFLQEPPNGGGAQQAALRNLLSNAVSNQRAQGADQAYQQQQLLQAGANPFNRYTYGQGAPPQGMPQAAIKQEAPGNMQQQLNPAAMGQMVSGVRPSGVGPNGMPVGPGDGEHQDALRPVKRRKQHGPGGEGDEDGEEDDGSGGGGRCAAWLAKEGRS